MISKKRTLQDVINIVKEITGHKYEPADLGKAARSAMESLGVEPRTLEYWQRTCEHCGMRYSELEEWMAQNVTAVIAALPERKKK